MLSTLRGVMSRSAIRAMVYTGVAILIYAALASAFTGRPMLLTVVSSNSMYPTIEKGDVVVIGASGEDDSIEVGDIVVFRPESGRLASRGWIIHRVVGGTAEDGFITRGDGNALSDQEDGGAPPISQGAIVARALTVSGSPIKAPLIGNLILWLQAFKYDARVLPLLSLFLALVLIYGELSGDGRRRRPRKSRRGLDMQVIYILGGLTLAAVVATSMLATSQFLAMEYEVSPDGIGVLQGSPVGIISQGERVERPVARVENRALFPVIVSVASDDIQIDFNQSRLLLKPKDETQITMTVHGAVVGGYQARITVGLFLPFLPPAVVHCLAGVSYWLALVAVSLVPALPLVLYPLLEPGLRRQTRRAARRYIRQVARSGGIIFRRM